MRTFEQFLEDRGFQADACEATTHPDFYRLAASLYESAERAKPMSMALRSTLAEMTMAVISLEQSRNMLTTQINSIQERIDAIRAECQRQQV